HRFRDMRRSTASVPSPSYALSLHAALPIFLYRFDHLFANAVVVLEGTGNSGGRDIEFTGDVVYGDLPFLLLHGNIRLSDLGGNALHPACHRSPTFSATDCVNITIY